MKTLLIGVVLLACLMPTAAKAGHSDDVRAAAHIGLSYLIDDAVGQFSKKAFHMSDLQAETFGAFTTIFVGLVYKAAENSSGFEALRATGLNAIGIATHALFHLKIDF